MRSGDEQGAGYLSAAVQDGAGAAETSRASRTVGGSAPTFTGIWWYSDYPDHYAGDALFASEEKGVDDYTSGRGPFGPVYRGHES